MKQLVINTSSSLFFTRIGLLPHLLRRFKIITTYKIYQEVKDGIDIGYRDAQILMQYFEDKKIEIFKAESTLKICNNFNIKETDASIIALAQEKNCFLASEDKQIEKICLITQTSITNTAILIYLLWQKNDFNDERVFLLLDLLLKNGYNKEICLKIKEKIIRGDKNV
ncbi:hypothetical protein HYU06_03050 [Candidatus Woesearchaeota archaeon]|nr:hypothetical protein [Candidatus Woesearchaeota archaeon]